MKKTIIIIIGVVICLGVIAISKGKAQSIDNDKMERDLRVAERILSDLMNEDKSGFRFHVRAEASYVENYGVIFVIPQSFFTYSIGTAPEVSQYILQERERRLLEEADAIEREERARSGEENDKRDREVRVESEVQDASPVIVKRDSEVDYDELIEAWKIFLVDYSNLISQLSSDQKIMIKLDQAQNTLWSIVGVGTSRSTSQVDALNISAEIKVSDLQSYNSGKISRDAAMGKVEVIKAKPEEIKRDIRMFSSIVEALYESSVSETYFCNAMPRIERTKGLGVVYNFKFYSSNPSSVQGSRTHYMPTLEKGELSQDERDKIVKEMYPKFENGFVDNLIEYGKTISSLDDNELVIIKADMTTCDGCEIPKSVEFTVQAKVLKDFSAGKISKSNAVKEVKIKKIGEQ